MKIIVNLQGSYPDLSGTYRTVHVSAIIPLHVPVGIKMTGGVLPIESLAITSPSPTIGPVFVSHTKALAAFGELANSPGYLSICVDAYRDKIIQALKAALDHGQPRSGSNAAHPRGCNLEMPLPELNLDDISIRSSFQIQEIQVRAGVFGSSAGDPSGQMEYAQLAYASGYIEELTSTPANDGLSALLAGLWSPQGDVLLTNSVHYPSWDNQLFIANFSEAGAADYAPGCQIQTQFVPRAGVITLPNPNYEPSIPEPKPGTEDACCPSPINYIAGDVNMDPSVRSMAANWQADRIDNQKRVLTHGAALLIDKLIRGDVSDETFGDGKSSGFTAE